MFDVLGPGLALNSNHDSVLGVVESSEDDWAEVTLLVEVGVEVG